MVTTRGENPFRLPRTGGALRRAATAAVERCLGLDWLARRYDGMGREGSARTLTEAALRELGVAVEVSGDAAIPASGPVLVVANHPTGGVEGMALLGLLLARRADVRVLANQLLGRIPELRDLVVPVDPFGHRDAAWSNGLAWRNAARWLGAGGALLAFPAGEVAHLRWRSRTIEEGPWSAAVAALLRRVPAPVVPVHVSGRNPLVFHLAGLAHPLARTAMLPRAMMAQRGRTLTLRVGSTVVAPARDGARDEAVAAALRARCMLQGLTTGDEARPARSPAPVAPLATPVAPDALDRELGALPQDRRLAAAGELEVWCCAPGETPAVLEEIGRLREIAFRAVGEGTGAPSDLDAFDATYHHLVAWSPARRAIVGAYRVGVTTDLLAAGGVRSLYTHTLFRYSRALLDDMGPALELGRSFVRPEDQRSFQALPLLWKGIGRFVLQRPDHVTLFGPVSMSADYLPVSRELVAAHLDGDLHRSPLARHVRPRRPVRHELPRPVLEMARDLDGLEALSAVVAALEPDGKGLPVLLRQYHKLGARFLGSNVDDRFSDVVDALVAVDLRLTPPRILSRYLGPSEAARLLARHEVA